MISRLMPGRALSMTGAMLLAGCLSVTAASHAADGTDLFRQWEKQQGMNKQTGPASAEPPASKTETSNERGQRQARAQAVDFGDFLPTYSSTVKYEQINKFIRESGALEGIAQSLNEAFALPTNVRIGYRECGQINAFYEPATRSIITCYELMESLYTLFKRVHKDEKKAWGSMVDAHMFIFFHELGHALISVWDLPITGREEDAVDQLASYILIMIGEAGFSAIIGAATWFGATGGDVSAGHFADEHSLSQQRYYNILCWLYGSSPEFYQNIITEDVLPKARAARCPGEFYRMSQAWDKLLEPFLKR